MHILDYKPDARTNKPIAQLAIYALALTRLVPGLKLFDIKCAWFNEEEYCEFFPRTLFAAKKRVTDARHPRCHFCRLRGAKRATFDPTSRMP